MGRYLTYTSSASLGPTGGGWVPQYGTSKYHAFSLHRAVSLFGVLLLVKQFQQEHFDGMPIPVADG